MFTYFWAIWVTFYLKNAVVTFWATLGKIGHLFIQPSGLTDVFSNNT